MQDLLTRLLLAGGGGFSPSALFGGGAVQGAWYDPSDITTLFQDSAGTTPVTAVEQPVGLMLDKSKGLTLGSELVTNGNPFVSGSWTLAANWSVVGGKLQSDGTQGGFTYAGQTISISSGKRYKVTVTVSSVNNAGLKIILSGGAQVLNPTAPGVYTAYFPYVSTALIQFESGSGTTCVIDSISVRELPGNHAYQSTSASRPTLRARYNLLTYSEQFENAAWAKNTSSITATNGVDPLGGNTADRWVSNPGSTTHYLAQQLTLGTGISCTISVWVRSATGSNQTFTLFIGSSVASTTLTATSDWQRFTFTGVTTSTLPLFYGVGRDSSNNAVDLWVWGAQLTVPSVFPSNTYQRIAAATDYDTAGFPPYLFFDGTDDSMLTNSIDFATVTSDGQARRNLLLNPTQFDAAGWTKSVAGDVVSPNAAVAPDGTTTAEKFIPDTSNAQHRLIQTVSATAANNVISVYAKPDGYNWIILQGSGFAWFDVANGVVGTQTSSTGFITPVGNGWYRCTLVLTSSTTGVTVWAVNGNNVTSFAGDGTSGIFIYGAQLETGSTATAFQNIGTDQMTVFAGVTKSSDAVTGIIAETSADVALNNGAIRLNATNAPGAANYRYSSRGTILVNASTGTVYPAPITNVLSGSSNIGADIALLRVNGVQAANSTADQGTGNYGNYPLYIGSRNNAAIFFNGNLYSLIVQGATPTSSQLVSTEQWVAAKTPLGSV